MTEGPRVKGTQTPREEEGAGGIKRIKAGIAQAAQVPVPGEGGAAAAATAEDSLPASLGALSLQESSQGSQAGAPSGAPQAPGAEARRSEAQAAAQVQGGGGKASNMVRNAKRRRAKREMVAVEAPEQDSNWFHCVLRGGGQSFQSAGGLVWHLNSTHAGAAISSELAKQLKYLGKVSCESCGTIRDHKRAHCNSCGTGTRQRLIRAGDYIPGGASGAGSRGRSAAEDGALQSGGAMAGAGGEAETLDELRQREADDWAADH